MPHHTVTEAVGVGHICAGRQPWTPSGTLAAIGVLAPAGSASASTGG